MHILLTVIVNADLSPTQPMHWSYERLRAAAIAGETGEPWPTPKTFGYDHRNEVFKSVTFTLTHSLPSLVYVWEIFPYSVKKSMYKMPL